MRTGSILLAGAACVGLSLAALHAQSEPAFEGADETRTALQRAQQQRAEAEKRGERLEQEARSATEAAEKTAREAAALAARIQQAEAEIEAAEVRIAMIDEQRGQLLQRLAKRREPLVRLTAALQKLARRPLVLSAFRPGSLRETVYLSAMLETTIPQVRERTAALRAEIDQGRRLEAEARQVLAAIEAGEKRLADRRRNLAAIETRQRLKSRQVGGEANREKERALALSEQARDLDTLVERLDRAGSLREDLAALPGPVIRPADPEMARVAATSAPAPANTGAPAEYQLPVGGRTVAGFGSAAGGGTLNQGISIVPRDGAQVVAPASGRVAFAGPYRGYDRIVIVEHANGWTSLITGLARTDVSVGEELVGGAPLGVAGAQSNGRQPVITLELRRDGDPVNPLNHVR